MKEKRQEKLMISVAIREIGKKQKKKNMKKEKLQRPNCRERREQNNECLTN